jgi:hypothetical protein
VAIVGLVIPKCVPCTTNAGSVTRELTLAIAIVNSQSLITPLTVIYFPKQRCFH